MGLQFTLYATNKDLGDLEALLRQRGDVDFLADEAADSDDELRTLATLPLPTERAAGQSLFCFLVPRHLPRLVVLERSKTGKADVDLHASSVIDFWRPPFDGRVLGAGRMFLETKTRVDGVWRPKADADFLRWAASVFKATKKWMARDPGGFYVAPDAAAGLKSGAFTRRPVGH